LQVTTVTDFLTTSEVAEYLRIKERTVYELVRNRRIPCSRATGRLLFPRSMIDAWVRAQVDYVGTAIEASPPVIAGSHDPLLDWAIRESGCELALMTGGSSDGLRRLELGKAVAAGLHLLDPASGDYNGPAMASSAQFAEFVLVHWARREQGLVVARGNPRRILSIADLARPGLTVARRQDGSGSQLLLLHLLARAGLDRARLNWLESPMRSESDVAAAVLEGRADCGLAIASVTTVHPLDFIPIHRERFDLAMRRRDYFESPLQRLLWFTRAADFSERARALGGYDVAATGKIMPIGAHSGDMSKMAS
jgi:putative molybdopterin biosynthesis protein